MAYDHAAMKVKTRRAVHKTFGIEMLYVHRTLAAPVALRVRYHTKQDVLGDLQAEGYPMSIDGIERVIFDIDELILSGVVVERGAKLQIVDKSWPAGTLIIETKEKSEGPVEEIWRVVKE